MNTAVYDMNDDAYHASTSDRRPPKKRWPVWVTVWAVILVLGAATGVWLSGEWRAPVAEIAADADDAKLKGPQTEAIPLAPAPRQPDGQSMNGGGQSAFPGNNGNGQQPQPPKNPCAGVHGEDAKKLIATPDPLHLKGGATKGGFTLHNCGQDDIHFSTWTKSWVKLDHVAGTVGGESTREMPFAVDTSDLPSGPYSFKIKVHDGDHSLYVDVHGTKLGGYAPVPSPSQSVGGLTAGGPTGCAAKCVTKAWLTPIHGTPNVSLEVRTNTSAKIAALVDTKAPVKNAQGHPVFADADLALHTGGAYVKKWVVTLKPLQAATKYHVIVWAADSKGGKSFKVGTFTTTKPVTGLSAGKAGGCSSNCVKTAFLTPKPGKAGADVTVKTHVPTTMRLYAHDQLPHKNVAGEPYFPGALPAASTGGEHKTQWAASLNLKHDKTYHVILKVTDEHGHSQFHTGKVTTPPAPKADHVGDVLVTFHKIHVSDDADNTVGNRTGELWFRFEVAGERQAQLDTGKRKVKAPAWVGLDDGNRSPGRSVLVEDAPDKLPIRVQGQERDGRKPGFCAAGASLFEATSGRTSIDKCYELEWNTAAGTVDLAKPADGGALPPCYGFGVTGDICVLLKATGDDPRFDVYVTVDFL